MPRLSKIGAAALAAFGWTGLSTVTASYLQVAGGGGGGGNVGSGNRGAGGGAGGYLTGTVSLNPLLSYTVVVGAGGTAQANGSNSQFGTLTASVGGGYGGSQNGASSIAGGNGGSGGGGPSQSGSGSNAAGSGTSGQGNAGAAGTNAGGQPYGQGGGGGAGAAGSLSNNPAGAGGVGLANSITGTSVYYAGGGGGGTYSGSSGVGGSGGNGGGGTGGGTNGAATAGTANTGGGGGGQEYSASSGANGGSGVVIISYPSPQKFGGGIVTTSGSNTIHTFQTSGTLSPLSTLSASYLIVAGGGGGSYDRGGGGGAGGLLTSSGLTIDTNSIYVVTVGSGGAGATTNANGTNGTNSTFSAYATASVGGGGGASYVTAGGSAGGSGGGGSYTNTGGAGTSGQGFAGGNGESSVYINGGGGGGASAAGQTPSSSANGGNGGAGTASSISGASVTYAGGGGGGHDTRAGGSAGSGGSGGGGAGGSSTAGTAGTANLGGGGGGGGNNGGSSPQVGGTGGSGIVIISYAGATQQMAGGTVTISGGNVIHTFTSSGYLTPLKYVGNSLRLRSSASAYLSRTPSVAGSQTTWTYSVWVKRGIIGSGTNENIIGAGSSDTVFFGSRFANDNLVVEQYNSGFAFQLVSSAVYRDPAAWYHIVVVYDSSNGTSSNRIKMYVNGTQLTSFSTSTYPSSSLSSYWNSTTPHKIATRSQASAGDYFDGYMTEVNFIDGQALTPNSFGTFNSYGVWQPITYGGSYGTNGFYLPFTNKTSTTTLGYDFSPNGNNWTTNNISLTAGSTYDSMTDVPTLTSTTVANYAVLNPLNCGAGGLTNGNLQNNGSGWSSSMTTIAFPATGNFYCEMTGISVAGSSQGVSVGILNPEYTLIGYTDAIGNQPLGYGWYSYGGSTYHNSSGTSYNGGATYTTGTVIGIQLNNGVLTFYNNGVSQGTAYSGITGNYCFAVSCYGTDKVALNCGQQPFVYTPPSGSLALNTYNI